MLGVFVGTDLPPHAGGWIASHRRVCLVNSKAKLNNTGVKNMGAAAPPLSNGSLTKETNAVDSRYVTRKGLAKNGTLIRNHI